jgi:gliding motility-associated-like protein
VFTTQFISLFHSNSNNMFTPFFRKCLLISFASLLLVTNKVTAQFVATWPLTQTATLTSTITGSNVTVGNAIVGDTLLANIAYSNTSGISLSKSPTSNLWPLVVTNGWHLDFPMSPVVGNDITIQSFNFIPSTSNGNSSQQMLAQLAYEKDGNNVFVLIGTPITINSGNNTSVYNYPAFTSKLYSGHSYKIRMYIYGLTANISSKTLKIKNATFSGITNPIGTQPSVVTNTAIKTGKYSGTATGTITSGTYFISESGVCWATTSNPTIANNKNNAGPISPTVAQNSSAAINAANGGTITNLTPNTIYHSRAYTMSETGDVFYGTDMSFITDPPAIATLSTNAVTPSSYFATSGGTILDSGGVFITGKGVCFGTSPNPTIALPTKTSDGNGNNNYSSFLKILTPATSYYARAYATNSVGTGYGNEIMFNTTAIEPIIISNTPNNANSLQLGNVIINNVSGVVSYTITAYNLTIGGNIVITAPAGFQVSLNGTSGFANSISIPVTTANVINLPIYVHFMPNTFGTQSGTITHTTTGFATITTILTNIVVTGVGIQDPSNLANSGTDFWTGFGFQSDMNNSPSSSSAAQISIFVATGNQPSTVVVDVPGIAGAVGFPQTVTIPANSFQEFSNFPIGANDKFNTPNAADARLYFTGKTNRGIHVYSSDGVPVSVWMFTHTKNNSAGASMIFPTNTWGTTYTVQAYGGISNSGTPSSFFYVIAKEDSTIFEFKPTADILDSSVNTIFKENSLATYVKYHKDSLYTDTLQKGQIFNAMGFIKGSGGNNAEGLDLTGTYIKTKDCNKKIAVFGGNGRVLVATATNLLNKGSDNLVQQMFPRVAWGTKYLTAPTKTMEYNIFRVNVLDVNTKVWVNSPNTHTAATALSSTSFDATGLYYRLEGNQPLLIESDKPVTVTQFVIAGSAPDGQDVTHPTIGNGGLGDPEMILLSPVQQAIKSATVYAANFKNGNTGASYINVIIKKTGVSSFKIDGLQVADTGLSSYSTVGVPGIYDPGANTSIPMIDVFVKHPSDTTYYYAKIRVASGMSHTISSSEKFNAIAYGMAQGESYGYNAGTNLQDLTKFLTAQNPYGNTTNDSIIPACINNDFTFKAALPFKPDTITWDFHNAPSMLPNSNTVVQPTPNPIDSVTVDGAKLYYYQLNTTYKFTAANRYNVTLSMNATNADGCTGLQKINLFIDVVAPPKANFITQFKGCIGDTTFFTDKSIDTNNNVIKWNWNFGNSPATTSLLQNPNIVFANAGNYNVSLRAINNIGCFKDTILPIKINPAPQVSSTTFSPNYGNIYCINNPYFIKGLQSSTNKIVKWYWNFGDTKSDSSLIDSIAHTYTSNNNFAVNVYGIDINGCKSNTLASAIPISKLKTNFTFTSPVCIGSNVTFIDSSISGSSVLAAPSFANNFKYQVNTIPAQSFAVPNPIINFNQAGTFDVKLVAANVYSASTISVCSDSITKQIVVVNKISKPTVTVNSAATTASSITFTWAAIAGATGYQVSENGTTWLTPSSGNNGLLHTLNNLTANTNYNVCVRALGFCNGDSACASSKTILLTTDVYVANVFTPTSNNVNNKFMVQGYNIKTVSLLIFNQLGQKIFEASGDANTFWDGTQNGILQPSGNYAYIAIVTAGNQTITKKGLVNLIR